MKREQRRAARREDVQRAALKIVAQEGLSALTIQRVAKDVEASVGGLYRYYPSKEAMIQAVASAILAQLDQHQLEDLERARVAVAQAKAEPAKPNAKDWPLVCGLAELLVLLTVYTRLGERNFEHHALLNAVHADVSPVLSLDGAKELDRAVGPLLMRVISSLTQLEQLGVLQPADPAQRSFVLWGAMFGMNQFRTRDRFSAPEYSAKALLANTFTALLIGFGARPELAQAATKLWRQIDEELLASDASAEN